MNVTIVAKNPETLDALQGYLRGVGIVANGTRFIDKAWGVLSERATAVILFPDDFARAAVVSFLTRIRAARPSLVRVVVTREPRVFERIAERLVVVAKPAWGWRILDALRAGEGKAR
jgi:hypothetical protein